MFLIKNGRVLDPASKTDAAMDVLLEGEHIAAVAPAGKWSGQKTPLKFSMRPA